LNSPGGEFKSVRQLAIERSLRRAFSLFLGRPGEREARAAMHGEPYIDILFKDFRSFDELNHFVPIRNDADIFEEC
jgi:hypothetical protein